MFEDSLVTEICKCRWCGAETLLVSVSWQDAPDEPGDDVITLVVQCLNEDCCKFGKRGLGIRLKKEDSNG